MNKEEMLPLVSVIIPCYNHEKYIIECLNSILNCTYPNLELIIIDDGSKDKSYEMAKDWIIDNSKRFERTSINKQTNKGICKTFNLLISLTKGTYIFPIASDDKITKNGIYESYLALNKTDKDILIADVSLMDENSKIISKSAFNYFSKPVIHYNWTWIFYTDIILNWNPPFQYFMIKKDYYDQYGMYDESISFEDRDFILNAILNNKLTHSYHASREYRIRLNDRLTPGLNHDNLLVELDLITKKYRSKFSGYYKFLLILLSSEKTNDTITTKLLKKFFTRSILRIIKYTLKIIFLLGNRKC